MNVDPNRTEWKVSVPLLLLDEDCRKHPELCHLSPENSDIIIIKLLANNRRSKMNITNHDRYIYSTSFDMYEDER